MCVCEKLHLYHIIGSQIIILKPEKNQELTVQACYLEIWSQIREDVMRRGNFGHFWGMRFKGEKDGARNFLSYMSYRTILLF